MNVSSRNLWSLDRAGGVLFPTSGPVKWYKNYFLHERVFHEPVVSEQSWRGSVPHLWPCEMIQKLFLTWTCLPWTCGLWTELERFCSPPLAVWNDTKIISYMNVSSMNLWSLDRAGGVLFPTSGPVKWYKNYFLHERVFHEPVVSGQSWRGSVPHLWPCEMIQELFLTWTCLPWTCGLWTKLEGFCSPPLAMWNDTKIISYMNVSSMNPWSLDRAGGVLFPTSGHVKWYKNYFLHERVFHEPVVSGQRWRGSVPHLWPCKMIQKLFLTWTCLPWTRGLWIELDVFCSPPLAMWNDTKIISYMNVSSMNLWSLDRAGGVLFPTSGHVKWYKNYFLHERVFHEPVVSRQSWRGSVFHVVW